MPSPFTYENLVCRPGAGMGLPPKAVEYVTQNGSLQSTNSLEVICFPPLQTCPFMQRFKNSSGVVVHIYLFSDETGFSRTHHPTHSFTRQKETKKYFYISWWLQACPYICWGVSSLTTPLYHGYLIVLLSSNGKEFCTCSEAFFS